MIITDEQQQIDAIIQRALAEDLGSKGDITSESIFSANDTAEALIRSKAHGVLSGMYLLPSIFARIDPTVVILPLMADGSSITPGTELCRISGHVRSILSAERIILNFLQRLSGIATQTAILARAIAHTNAKLLDTRKTTPTLRLLEKRAVLHGNGCNHRFGLFDMILIKDTHVKRAGGVTPALEKAFAYRTTLPPGSTPVKIEVEVQSIAEFSEALVLHPDRIMLDNMSPDAMATCVTLNAESGNNRPEIEASGSITLASIAAVAETGVDFISCGSITHSAPALDIHLILI